MRMRGVRGAITVEENTADAILEAADKLLHEMIRRNAIIEDDLASLLFTTTPDLDAVYPAKAARNMGWTRVALMGFQEMNVPGGLSLCIRVLMHWHTDKSLDEIEHVFLRDAVKLRPDLAQATIKEN